MLLLLSCSSDATVESRYCSLPARFTFSPVSSISQLNSSCRSMGEWCTIKARGTQYVFTKPDGSQGTANRTALAGYTGFYLGVSGFIVGLPTLPEIGMDVPQVVCYDLACPVCYEEGHVARDLTLEATGTAACRRCARTYDLNNLGLVIKGPAGRSLYRYRIYYQGDALAINN